MSNRIEQLCNEVAQELVSMVQTRLAKNLTELVPSTALPRSAQPRMSAKQMKARAATPAKAPTAPKFNRGKKPVSTKELVTRAFRSTKMELGAADLMFKGVSEAYVRKLLHQLKGEKVIKPGKARGKYIAVG